MADMKDDMTPKQAKGWISSFMAAEIMEFGSYRKLGGAASQTPGGSPERAKFLDFMRKRTQRLGLSSGFPSNGVHVIAHQFVVTDQGKVKLRLMPDEAKLVLAGLAEGKPPLRDPSPTARWLSRWGLLDKDFKGAQFLKTLEEIAAIPDGDFRNGVPVAIKQEDLWLLPKDVIPMTRNGKLELTEKGDAKIFIPKQAAADALALIDGRPLRHQLSATATLLMHCPEIVSMVDKNGVSVEPKKAIADVANSGRRLASTVEVEPWLILAAAERMKKPQTLVAVFSQAVGESRNFGQAIGLVVARSRARVAEATVRAPAPARAAAESGAWR